MLTHLRETFNHLRMHLFIYLFIKTYVLRGRGHWVVLVEGETGSGQGSLQRTQPTNDKMSLYVPCLIHCGPRCHPGCCSPLWGSRVKLARRQVGFCKPFVGPAHCWTVQADSWWDLILSKGVSYGAQRDRAICFAKGDADSQSQRRHSSCWLPLACNETVFFHVESQVDTGWSSGCYSCPTAIIFPGHAGVQLMRQLRTSSVSDGGLHAMPCGVLFHW